MVDINHKTMGEIGSEFWEIPICERKNDLFPSSSSWYVSGRSALYDIIDELKWAKTVAMPSWCCDSMIKPFTDNGIEVFFYPVLYDNRLIQEKKTDCDILFVIDYFGYTNDTKTEHDCVIRDVTHSMFSYRYDDADYSFGSLRKWCGFLTGGFAYSRDGVFVHVSPKSKADYIELRKRAMEKKRNYIEGGERGKFAHLKIEYRQLFESAEEMLDEAGVWASDADDIEKAQYLDVSFIRTKRRENAALLMSKLKQYLVFPELKENDCPLFVPIIVPDGQRDALRKRLIDNQIYCPVHWPVTEYHKLNEKELSIYNNELSLICDQRYDENDMGRIVDCIKNFFEGKECQ